MSMNKEVFKIVQFLKDTLRRSGQKGFALGMSGGIDSAVCAALAKRAIDELATLQDHPFEETRGDYKLDLIILPMGNIADDANTAKEIAAHLDVDIRTVELGDTLSAFLAALHPTQDGHTQPDPKVIGNLKARMRMSAIYYAANEKGLLVLGTDNLAETYTGYFTKHGDGAADVFPLSDFTKREVYEIGRFLGLPESVLSRQPSAGLWEGQTDESEMGVPYNFIDNVLEDLGAANALTYTREQYNEYHKRLNKLHSSTQHKRDAPHIYKREQVIPANLPKYLLNS